MDILNFQNLLKIIPIAAILSVAYFLVKFFGKAYSDQVPFVDNRSWHEEISGIFFFSGQVLSPAILVLLIYSKGWEFWKLLKEDWILLGISILIFISSCIISKKSKVFFKEDDFYEGNQASFLKKISKSNEDIKFDDGDKMILLRFIFLPLVTIILMYGISWLYELNAYYHLSSAVIYLFLYLTSFALLLSLIKRHIFKANIYFINSTEEEIRDCRVIKVNDDNVKIRTSDGKFIIINKNSIFKIEFIENISVKELVDKQIEKSDGQL